MAEVVLLNELRIGFPASFFEDFLEVITLKETCKTLNCRETFNNMFLHSGQRNVGAKNFPDYKKNPDSNATFRSSLAFQMGVLERLNKS